MDRAEKMADFERLVAEYESPLLRYAACMVRDTDAAQDLVQDAFIKLYRKWKDELKPSSRMSSWLYRVVHNRAIDYLRKESRRRELHRKQVKDVDHIPADRGVWFRISEAAEKAAMALDQLSPREKQLVILKVYEEKSYREIAEIAGLTPTNVGYILHHAMKKMARIVDDGKINREDIGA